MTDDQRWARINSLMNAALDQPEAARDAWLKRECGDDVELLEEIRSLLAFDAEKTGGVRRSIEALAGELSSSAESTYIGERVGSYRITEKIAEGGMGIVFLAEHAADDFDQHVAIKLLPQNRLDETASRRFVEERRILAGLSHPNIARLIDGGTLASGVPFIVMEYIDGHSIDAWCRDNALDNAEIISLVAQVCDAVQYAHRKLIIHRDIKPANIIVDRQGVPKLLDFGIAKLLDPGDEQPDQTRAENRALTPMYASPEQIEGLPITTAADVYGVGMLLYRLLTGQMPYAPTGPTPRDLELAILSQTPEKPSAMVATQNNPQHDARWQRQQQKALRGELDTILLTALRKDPERRYGSVAALREDLTRFLEHRPIVARGDSPFYVLKKFLRRHRWPVGFATAGLLAALLIASYYTARLQVERDTAKNTAAFFAELFEARDPYRRNKDGLTVETLMNEGITKLEEDETLSPLVRARLLTTIALVQKNLGQIDRADAMASEALELVETTEGRSAPEAFNPLGVLMRIRIEQARYDDARELGERFLAVARDVYGETSMQTAQATHQLWLVAYRAGIYDDMVRWGEQTYSIRKAVYDHNDMAIATGANALGITYWREGELEKASEFYAESARIQNAQPERNDMQYASLLHNLGLIYNDSGRYEEAIKTYREAIGIRKASGTEKDTVLPLTMYSLAHSLNQNGDRSAAHRMFLETVPRQVAVAGPETHMVAYALSGQGVFLESINAPELARPILEESARVFATVFDEPHADLAATWIGLAYIAMNDGEYAEARDLLQRALKIRTVSNGPDSPSTLRAQTALARLEFERGDFTTAESILSEILATYGKGADAEHPFAVEAMTWLGRTRLRQGNAAGAVSILEQALKLGLERSSAGHVENVQRRLWLAEARVASGHSDARDDLQRAKGELAAIEAEWKTMLAEFPVPPIEELLVDDAA